MVSIDDIKGNKVPISLIGLGYVGMPIAVEFDKKGINVIGFDVNKDKIDKYKNGIDPTAEVGEEEISNSSIKFTSDPSELKRSLFHIVAVSTPINEDKTPNLDQVISASKTLANNLSVGSIVVYESTVYPGVTEEICIPVLEKNSGLKCGKDFFVGYSPERINPGDKEHRLNNIKKIVSGMNTETLKVIADMYKLVVDAGIHKASSIKVAEAAKVIENSQRDINIAFVNELAIIFNKMGIDTSEVLEAAGTKWNFLPFKPGLVGGHCIGIDPYYLTYKAEQFDYHSKVILAGRRINDSMGKYIAEQCIKNLISLNKFVNNSKVAIMGFTFKENCPDVRNTKVFDVVRELKEYGISPLVYDPVADKNDVKNIYKILLCDEHDLNNVDCLIIAVNHSKFKDIKVPDIQSMFKDNGNKCILMDIKGSKNKNSIEELGIKYWRL